MQIVKTLSKITAEFLDTVFWQLLILFDQLVEITTRTVFKDNPQVIPGFIPVEES